MLYALAVGFGRDPCDPLDLVFAYERDLAVLPTFATVLAWGAGVSVAQLGVDRAQTLHAAEHLVLHAPIPTSGAALADSRVVAAYDRGPRGAIVVRETQIRDLISRRPLATLVRTALARADGGFGGPPEPACGHRRPNRAPDVTLAVATRPEQALLYRLCGDRNPLHADPEAARRAGFERPILHGLCTLGIACGVVVRAGCAGDPSLLRRFGARFSAPVFPGDDLVFDLWQEERRIVFEGRVPSRGVTVLRDGLAELGAPP